MPFTEIGDGIRVTQLALDQARHVADGRITGLTSVTVVEYTHIAEVDIKQTVILTLAGGGLQGTAQHVVEHGTVIQSRQCIKVGMQDLGNLLGHDRQQILVTVIEIGAVEMIQAEQYALDLATVVLYRRGDDLVGNIQTQFPGGTVIEVVHQ